MKPTGVAGVSNAMKNVAVIALIGGAIVLWYLRRDRAAPPAAAATTGSAATTTPASPTTRPPAHVKRVTPEERRVLASQIEKARVGRAAMSAPAGPSLTPQPAPSLAQPALSADDPDQFRTTMRAAMTEVIPYIADCYNLHADSVPDELNVVAKLTLLGDPDIGTLINTEGLTDDNEAALPSDFDLCMRDSLAGLQLPALAEGEEIKVTYPFMFTR